MCREGLGIALFIAFINLYLLCALSTKSLFDKLWQILTDSTESQGFGGDLLPPQTVHAALALGLTVCCLVGRALFYVLVIPTTMPGAFFWRNKGFEQHAGDSGLAHMPQSALLP